MSGDVGRILAEAAELEPPRRAAFLDSTCGDDDDLRAEVESLLEVRDRAGWFLEVPAPERFGGRLTAGDTLGRFRIERELASGGSGTVYEAVQDRPRRQVALKVLHSAFPSDEALRRFLDEAEILARLEHPDVAHVYEAGVENGVPWFAMEYVPASRSLIEHTRGLPRQACLELMARVCDAVHHGHQKGVIHRDLKPSNILVRDTGPKVIDFGIARSRDTEVHDVAGTLPYMSPEHLDPGSDLDVRADVYSLGVVLCEVLTGRRPFPLEGRTIAEATRTLETAEPNTGSLRGDLRAIVRRALARDREARYASAAALAEDLRRYLRLEPIVARPPSWAHRLSLFTRRRTVAAVALLALALVLAAGITVSLQFAIREQQQRLLAERHAYVATLVAANAALQDRDAGEARVQLDRSPAHLRGWEWFFLRNGADLSERTLSWPGAYIHGGCVSSGTSRVAAVASGRTAVRVWDVGTGEVVFDLVRGRWPAKVCCALSPDGELLALGHDKGGLEVRRLPFGDVVYRAQVSRDSLRAVVFDREGERLATASVDGTVQVWSAREGARLESMNHPGGAFSVVFSRDGRRLITGGSRDTTIRIWDLSTGEEVAQGVGHTENVESLAVSPDGAILVSGSMDSTVRGWNAHTGENLAILEGHTSGIKSVTFSPDGGQFASASIDSTVKLWSAEDWREVTTLVGHSAQVRAVGYLPSGAELVTLARDSTARVWSATRRREARELVGLERWVDDIAFLDDGTLVAAARDGAIARWDPETGRPLGRFPANPGAPHRESFVRFIRSGEQAFAVGDLGATVLVDVREGTRLREFGRVFPRRVYAVALTPDEDRLVVSDADQLVVWTVGAPAPEVSFIGHPYTALALAVHPTRPWFASSAHAGTVKLWTYDGDPIAEITDGEDGALALAFHPAGNLLAVGRPTGTIEVYDTDRFERTLTMSGHSDSVRHLAFSPDGSRLASAANDDRVRLWELQEGRSLLVLRGHPIYAVHVAWSADGRSLASGGADWGPEACAVRIWPGG